MKKTELNKQKKRTALLDAAYRLFLEKGFAQTTIADIAEAAGVAKGTFYLYFTDKYDLRDRLTAAKAYPVFDQAWNALPAHNRMSFSEQMVFVADQILDQLEADSAMTRFLGRRLGEALSIASSDGSDTGMALFLRHTEDSDYLFNAPEIMISLIIELTGGIGCNAIINGQPAPLEEMRPYLRETITDIVARFSARPRRRSQNDLPVELL